MEEQTIMEKLISLDTRAVDINTGRKKQLVNQERRYKEEEQKILKDYANHIEKETREITKNILQEAQKEVEKLKLDSKVILDNMEKKFEKSLEDITDEIIIKIFSMKKESHG